MEPYLLEGSLPGTIAGCVDAAGNFISITAQGPGGDWCRKFAGARVTQQSKIGKCNCKKTAMRNFIDFKSLTQDPLTGGLVVAGVVVGGIIGNAASKTVKIPVLATKYPKVHKWVWIVGVALAGGAIAKYAVDKYNEGKI